MRLRIVFVLLILIATPEVNAVYESSSSFSVFPNVLDLGHHPSNFTSKDLEGEFLVSNTDAQRNLQLKVQISGIPQNTFVNIQNIVNLSPGEEKKVPISLEINPDAGRFSITVRMTPMADTGGSGSTAVPTFEGKILYTVSGNSISAFSITSQSSMLPFSIVSILQNTNDFSTKADISIEFLKNGSIIYSEVLGTTWIDPMGVSPTEISRVDYVDLDESGIIESTLTVIFSNSTHGYSRIMTAKTTFISGVSKPQLNAQIISASESIDGTAFAQVEASNQGELPYLLSVNFIITKNNQVINSYTKTHMVSTTYILKQVLLFETTGLYTVEVISTAAGITVTEKREIEIAGYKDGGKITGIQSIVNEVVNSEDTTTQILIYIILSLIILILFVGLAIMLKIFMKKEKRYLPELPTLSKENKELRARMKEGLNSSGTKSIGSIEKIDVKLSKIHIFLTAGEALVTYDFKNRKLVDLTDISLSDLIVALNSLNSDILEFIPLKKDTENTIYIRIVDDIGFGVELEDKSMYEILQESATLKKALDVFCAQHSDSLSRGLVDLKVDDFKSIFKFK